MIDYTSPPYHFALTKDVLEHPPVEVEGKLISAESFLPARGRDKDTGYDVRCADPAGVEISPGCYFKIPMGFRVFAPDGWWLAAYPRSGTFMKRHCHALYGIIDELFEDQCYFVGQYIPDASKLLAGNHKLRVEYGERIAQVLPAPRISMPDPKLHCWSNETYDAQCKERAGNRGTGGFNSSGSF